MSSTRSRASGRSDWRPCGRTWPCERTMRSCRQVLRAARRAIDAALVRPRHVVLAAVVAGLAAGPRAPAIALAGAVLLLACGAATRHPGLGLCAACAILAGAV